MSSESTVDLGTENSDRVGSGVAGVDAVALKPAECDIDAVATKRTTLDTAQLVVDYEGRERLPDDETLAALAAEYDLRVTTPVRAAGFDPRGDDSLWDRVPETAGRVLVAGHPAYLDDDELSKAVAPRLGAGVERAPGAWVGTESVERMALATGATQFELLARGTDRAVRALRAAGFDGDVAVYAPTVLTDDEDAILDAVGEYVARRSAVREALPADAATDSNATGRAREVLSAAARDFALVGDERTVRERVADLRAAGVTSVVAYPARGVESFEN